MPNTYSTILLLQKKIAISLKQLLFVYPIDRSERRSMEKVEEKIGLWERGSR
jgi:hypothetical protein